MKAVSFLFICCSLFLLGNTQSAFSMSDSEIEKWMKEQAVPALAIGIIKNGQLQTTKVYGTTCEGKAVTANTAFNVASLTKPVVANLILRLVHIGVWSLDEPVANYWIDPNVREDQRSRILTTRQLLSHQGGFPNWRWNTESKKLAFQFNPGDRFQYSGEGYEYLREALEHRFQQPLNGLADTLLFSRLALHQTSFLPFANASVSTAYCAEKERLTVRENAADDLRTSIADYARFCLAVLNKDGLSDSLYAEMIKPHVKIKGQEYMGLGWEVLPNLKEGEYALLHTGSDTDASTLAILLPQTKEGLIVFTNSPRGGGLYPSLVTAFLSLGKEIMARAK